MNRHTPGPWVKEKDARVLAPNGWMIASAHFTGPLPDISVERVEGESWCDTYDRLAPQREKILSEQEASARLIATAPELLELLNDVFAIGDQLVSDVYGFEFKERARAAIAKATGKW